MERVDIMVFGRMASVPADKVSLVQRKETAVKTISAMQRSLNGRPATAELIDAMKYVRGLSARIGPCVIFK